VTVAYRCPSCVGALERQASALRCGRCAAVYPIVDGIADFSGGKYYDQFDETTELSAEHLRGLELENAGAITRIESYYLPKIGSQSRRVLDAGCGNGISVDLLIDAGHDAWGIDLSALRRWQWRERNNRHRLAVADGSHLPFGDGFFDVVLCSGLVEHIGVEEQQLEGEYVVKVRPDRDAARRSLLTELLRVIAPGGALYLDFPNGSFPIDFWHNAQSGKARLHSPSEGFLPTLPEIRRLLANVPVQVTAMSPNGRLAFRQVQQHWYGRLFAAPMRLLFRLMDRFPILAGSPINPYLVVRIVRHSAE
jgi:SAM-dependent methyltransferase